tara:strand:- start:701 stop:1318 length:618 start_codon:yes stop_codon:yes gene_type:complete
MEAHKVFSTPVLQTKPCSFTQEELNIVQKEKNNLMDNFGKNFSTRDTYVFKKLPKMYDFCNATLQHYVKDILKVNPKIDFYITQSWINYNPKESFHHAHFHPNSLLSGVLAIQNDSNIPLMLDRPHATKIFDNLLAIYDYSELNEFNSPKMSFSLPTGSLILFPSKIFHDVPKNDTSEDRITLAFNTFIRGDIGGPEDFLGKLHI